MSIWSRVNVKWGVVICIFTASICPGVWAIWLFDAAGPRNHHMVRPVTELILLVISGVSIMIGGIYLKSFDEQDFPIARRPSRL
jgi:hypothetical protein